MRPENTRRTHRKRQHKLQKVVTSKYQGEIPCVSVRFGTFWCNSVQLRTIPSNSVRFGTNRCNLVIALRSGAVSHNRSTGAGREDLLAQAGPPAYHSEVEAVA